MKFKTSFIDHTVVGGFGFTRDDYTITTGGYLYNADGSSAGSSITNPLYMNVYSPDNFWHGPTNFRKTAYAEGDLNVYSAYLFDTLKFGEQWLLNLGVRNDYTDVNTALTPLTPRQPPLHRVRHSPNRTTCCPTMLA